MRKSGLSFFLFFLIFTSSFSAKAVPDSFADLIEDLIPTVVSIASTTIVKKNPQYDQHLVFLKDLLLMSFLRNILIMSKENPRLKGQWLV